MLRTNRLILVLSPLLLVPFACGDDSSGDGSATTSLSSSSDTATSDSDSASASASATQGSMSESATQGSMSESATQGSDSDSTTTVGVSDSDSDTSTSVGETEGTSVGPTGSDSDSTTSTGTGTGTDSDSDSDSDSGTTGDPPDCEGMMMGNEVESLIWIANSSQGTVSKIDTVTMEELGRYRTRPDGGGSPSRTSVGIGGDVVVASRSGGVTKIFADTADCVESNGIPGIQTSQGADDILDWGEEECVAWHRPLAYSDNRPIAWTQGAQNPDTCLYEGAKVWTSASKKVMGSVTVFLLNGETGEIEQEKVLPDVHPNTQYIFGGYGGAVDSDDNFWFSQLEKGKLVKVSIDDLSHQVWDMPVPGYGMTIGASGYVWTCGENVARFNPKDETWDTQYTGGGIHTGGCMESADGVLFKASHFRIHAVDVETLEVIDVIDTLNPPQHFWGIALDFDGMLWAVPRSGTTAYKIDPKTHDAEILNGLVGAYTYSDMTGFALSSVVPQ